jgi:hypothetical protein
LRRIARQVTAFSFPSSEENTVVKILVVTGATLALVTAAAAADLPHPQTV